MLALASLDINSEEFSSSSIVFIDVLAPTLVGRAQTPPSQSSSTIFGILEKNDILYKDLRYI